MPTPKRPAKSKKKSAAPARKARLTWSDVKRIVHEFPGVTDGTSYGTPALFVRKKLLVRLRDDEESLVVRCDVINRDFLLRAQPKMFFLTDHYVDYAGILVRLDQAKPDTLRELVEDAWRSVAGARLIAELTDDRPPDRNTSLQS